MQIVLEIFRFNKNAFMAKSYQKQHDCAKILDKTGAIYVFYATLRQ